MIKGEVSLQNIRVQLGRILIRTGVQELNADILWVPGRTEIRVAGERCEEMGDDGVPDQISALFRAGDTERPAGIVNVTGRVIHEGGRESVWGKIIFVALFVGRYKPPPTRN